MASNQSKLRNRIRGEVRRGGLAAQIVIADARRSSPGTYGESIATAYASLPTTRPSILPQKYRSAADLFRYAPYDAIPLSAEIEWATQLACHSSRIVSGFRQEVVSLQDTFFRGNATAILDSTRRIAEVAGESSWLIEARIACLQAHSGLDAQRNYVQQVSASLAPTLLRPILYFVGQRNEELVSMQGFITRVEQTLRDWHLPDILDAYLKFKLIGLNGATDRQLSSLLRVAATSSVIDLYETLMDVLSYLVVSLSARVLRVEAAVHGALTKLTSRIEDDRLPSLMRVTGTPPERPPTPSVTRPDTTLHRMVRGARTGIAAGALVSDTLESRLIKQLHDIFFRTASAESDAQELFKFSLNHQFLRESPFLLLASTDARSDSSRATRGLARAFSALEAPFPFDQFESRTPQTEDAVPIFDLDYSNPAHPLAVASGVPALPGSAHAQIERHIERGELPSAQSLIDAVFEAGDAFDKLQVVRHEYSLHRRSGDWWTAVSLATDRRMQNPGFRRELPLHDILENKAWSTLREYQADPRLTVAIYLAIAERLKPPDSRLHATLRQALKRLLACHRATSCSELKAEMLGCSDALLVFLLRYVCVENNLQGLPGIDNSKDLAGERVRVCQRLRVLDPGNAELYDEETRELTYRLELQEGVATFDRSRVFINLEGIRRWARRALHEDFLRYQSLIDANSDTLAALQEAITKLRGNAPVSDVLLQLPVSDADKLLVDMLIRLRDQYLTNPEDGLDVFLSLRIRHGSLSGNLRGPLEEESLLTLKDETDGQYRPNTVWAQRLGMSGSVAEPRLHAAFDKFSATFDTAVNRIIRDIVQVRTKDRPDAAFSLPVTVAMMNILKSAISRTTSFDEFIAGAFELFGASMAKPLRRAKQALQETFKGTVEEAFETLRVELASVTAANYPALSAAVGRASTNVATAIDRVADWFTPDPLLDTSRTYSVADLVQMGIQITRNTHRGFSPVVVANVDSRLPPFKMSTGAIVVLDVVFTLLDNVFRRSGIPVSPRVTLHVALRDESHLEFHMVNEVAKGVRSAAVEERLSQIRANVASEAFVQSAAVEGGSGFIKLKRIGAASRSGARTDISFGFASDTSFEVRVAIPIWTEEVQLEVA